MIEEEVESKNNIITLVAVVLLLAVMVICGILFLTRPDDKQMNISTVPTRDSI